jgi:pimeloyl-ACP methyl ester carboxylesterase
LRKDWDIVLLDQRGTGSSRPSLDCPELDALAFERIERDLEDPEFASSEDAAEATCRNRLVSQGIDVAAYTTKASAADVEDVRKVLGYRQWNLVGMSYGTRVALAVMRDFPGSVRSAVLDSPLPPNMTSLDRAIPDMAGAFDALFDACEASEDCNSAYPNLRNRWIRLIREREADPIIEDVRTSVSGGRVDVYLDGQLIGLVPFWFLFNEEAIGALPATIDEMTRGRLNFIGEVIVNIQAQQRAISDGVFSAVVCREEVPFIDRRALRTTVADPPPEVAPGYPFESEIRACAQWNVPTASAREREPVRSAIPTLVLSGGFDPVTPPANGEVVARTLETSHVYVFPWLGHAVLHASSACVGQIVEPFLAEPQSEPDASCLPAPGLPHWR